MWSLIWNNNENDHYLFSDSPNGLQSAREFQSIFEHKGVAPSSSSGESNMGRTHNSQVRRQCKTPRLPQTLPINIHSDNMD